MKLVAFCTAALLLFSTAAFADCTTASGGRSGCNNGSMESVEIAQATSQTNSNGVTTTKTKNGGQVKSKNGNAVAQGPKGTTCAKTAKGKHRCN